MGINHVSVGIEQTLIVIILVWNNLKHGTSLIRRTLKYSYFEKSIIPNSK